jgi:8-oxo-dGTP pyrophosphatase MutT (NUDIX family)
MVYEKSAGIIVFRWHPKEGLQYLVLYHRGSYWNFPKGKLDGAETETQAAVRELREEAGISNVEIINGWKNQTQFLFKENRHGRSEFIKKDFILFLAKLPPQAKVEISGEHNGYAWLDFKTAGKYLRFKNLKSILAEADSFINDRISKYKKGLK